MAGLGALEGATHRGIQLNPSGRSATAIVTLTLALLGGVLLGGGVKDEPPCGIHTIRADDRDLSMIRDAGCTFVVQLFDWTQACRLSPKEEKGHACQRMAPRVLS